MRILVVLLVLRSLAVAAPSADDKKRAAEHFDRARSAYSFGNFDDAIREYQAAFDLTSAPEYVFNIAQTYRAKGDKPNALTFYKKYIELDPSGDGVASARSHIEALETALRAEADDAARRKAAADADRKRIEQAAANAAAARRDAIEAARRRAETDATRQRTTARYLRISGLAAGGAGLATLGVSAYFGLRARSLSSEASGVTGMWTEEAQVTVDRANAANRTMLILLGAGGAAAITGGVLYLVGARRTERRLIAPTAMRGGAGVLVEGRF